MSTVPKRDNPLLPASTDNSSEVAQVDNREDQFVRNLFLGLSVKEAGSKAGYSANYCISAIYNKFKSIAFQNKIRDYAIAHNTASVPKVANLYRMAVDQMYKEAQAGDLENLAKLKHIPRQILEIALS